MGNKIQEEKIELIPDAHLLMTSLRSVGYKPEMAISDLIDNCIAAGATKVNIDFTWEGTESYITITDNGKGMNRDELINSMKIGSADPLVLRDIKDLGRFGMGMKTAAFSLGKKLRVLSVKDGYMCNACWDLDYIEQKKDGKWNLIIDDNVLEYNKYLNLLSNGTVIIIEKLDRLIMPESINKSKTSFYKLIEKLRRYIGMIFHRFIEEDGLLIKFGEEIIKAWNPFILDNNATQELSEEEYCESNKHVVIQPYVLPHKTKFVSTEKYEEAQGPKGWITHQGIYVYRNRRLLVYGTWFDFIRKEPAFNLARIKLDITSDADYDWKIDIKKSTATPPIYIREMLERAITMCTMASAKVYNSRGAYSKNPGAQQLGYVWEQRKNRLGTYSFYINKKHPILNHIMKELSDNGKENIKAYLALIENYAPFMQSGITEYLNSSGSSTVDEFERQTDINEAKKYIQKFIENGFNKEEVESIVLGMSNYRYIAEDLKKIFMEEAYD